MAAFVESIPGVRRVFYGWWIVAVGISIAILNGAFYTYGFGIYFVPLLHELGASRAALGGVVGPGEARGRSDRAPSGLADRQVRPSTPALLRHHHDGLCLLPTQLGYLPLGCSTRSSW